MLNSVLKRDIVDSIFPYVGTENIIVLHGARQVGKTHILYVLMDELKKQGKHTHYIDLEDSRMLDLLDTGVEPFLTYLRAEGVLKEQHQSSGEKLFVFIDEIQYLTHPSSFLKLLADHHAYLQLIVSGSSSFNLKSKFSDSLVGRTVNFEIYPLTFLEMLRFQNTPYASSQNMSPIHIEKLIASYKEYMMYGGYPKIVLEPDVGKKETYLQQIIDTYVRKDIADLAHIRDIKKFNNLLKLLASQSGQLINITHIANTCALAPKTVREYLNILEQTYIIKLVTPYSTSATVEVVKTPKIFFYDTGLLQMLWFKTLKGQNAGNILETSVFSELCKKRNVNSIHFWRNKNQNEIDFILEDKQSILPIEVKYSFGQFNMLSISHFLKKYTITQFYIVGLLGDKKSPNYIYPWELPITTH